MSAVRLANWCAHCGQNLYGPVIGEPKEGVCVVCMKKHTHACPECTGAFKWQYQKHKGPSSGKCNRCKEEHPNEVRQLRCPRCNNERVVTEYPKKVTA